MRINRNYLFRAVSLVSRAMSAKHPTELLRSVKLSTDNGMLSISGIGLDSEAYASIPIIEGDDIFVVCVLAETFKTVLSKLHDEEIELVIVKKHLVIKRAGGNIKLSVSSAASFPSPSVPRETLNEMTIGTADLRGTINALLRGTEEQAVTQTPWQNVVCFQLAGPEFLAIGSDGKRMSLVDGRCSGTAGGRVNIPVKALRGLYGILGDLSKGLEAIRIVEDEYKIWVFASNNLCFAFTKLAHEFPDLNAFLTQMVFDKKLTVNVEALVDSTELVSALADSKKRSCRLEVREKDMLMVSESVDRGSVDEVIAVIEKGDFELVTGYNLDYILPIFRQLDGQVEIAFASDPKQTARPAYPMKIVSEDGGVRASYIIQSLQIYPGSVDAN